MLAGLGCALAPRIEWLIGLRALQGIGAAASMVIARAMVRDLFEGQQAVRMLSKLGGMIAAMPMLARSWAAGCCADGLRGIFGVLAGDQPACPDLSAAVLGESNHRRDPTAPTRAAAGKLLALRHHAGLPGFRDGDLLRQWRHVRLPAPPRLSCS